ncbi:4Fe-4S dicluster domain-containing protein [Leptospira wolffii]|uniref:Fe-S oxidoreductase n=1 Tax=Leptospira wolffii TaxID=409998 RepID=A0A2M9Z782_9LEPT|nr:heterodisulfide reductase-related iron-sulfur binding cluster [Leptospira wolffii]PJZ64182.1 Fe-S oxidoreductase [Leptospira wolffii]TGK56019.1 4Fe-4S dicluster domain-containing protein [Leptospira wolffii]TGK72065.1 4Fe-4S dicluster domain-containing protein [Leptospira wolffii]TGK73730.1 4Fe-4S dicluster domain-containing protein [Leptospira wolffii]TGL27642.1 4Fe-4S dicluster domain-containing protein [Leptospira wolffii]
MAISKIAFHLIFTILFAVANFVFVRAVLYRLKLVFNARKAQGTEDFREHPNWGFRIKSFVVNVILQKKNFKEPLRGIMHAFIFYGFVTYLLHTTSQFISGVFGYGMEDPYKFTLVGAVLGETANYVYEYALQFVSILVLVGLSFFAWRRWIQKAKGLDVHSPASAIVIGMISLLMLSTLLGEGAKAVGAAYADPYHGAAPIADAIGWVWQSIGVEYSSADLVVQIMWWLHILSVFAFMLYVPTSKHAHLIFAPFNYFLQSDTPKGALSKLNLEDETAVWGVTRAEDFPWPNLLDGLSCIECGRCQVQCPANRTGKVLNPKAIIVDLKHALMDKMPEVVKTREANPEGAADAVAALDTAVIGKYEGLSEEALWGCTTCYACVEACPVGNNQVNAIMEMRRHLVLVESSFPAELQGAFVNMENNSNPWGVAAHSRADWAEGLGVKTLAEDSNVDVLYWVGCAGAYDDRNKRIAQSFVKILQKADVKFGILGTEEGCSGDSARRGGNEYLYQTLAQANVDTMNGYNVKKIVTACPHCYNTIKNEYPQFGGNFEVIHHSEFINDLAKEGKIEVGVAEDANAGKFTYHDSCYIGRYNDNYENPRDLVKKVSGGKLSEPSDHHSKGLCCGAGGAQMWMEEHGERVNVKRSNQLLDTGATTIATACPFCITMITDGVKQEGKIEEVKVKDIAELIAENLK